MERLTLTPDGTEVPVVVVDTAIVGSGCAGWNAADWLYDLGRRDIVLITEDADSGTSRNTGSDKQTYYKLSLCGGEGDSVAAMAADLHRGGADGDTALAEAAGSVQSFMKLASLGVPFPTNEYGEFVGYKTDHDPRCRATSAGPLTSRYMTERLEHAVRSKGVPVLDHLLAFRLLTQDGRICGLLCLDTARENDPAYGLTVISAWQVILATGGPAICYRDSVYPENQTGMSGMALEIGAAGANLQEWQYGLASLGFRWNVSGSYQQALPRYISVDDDGVEREFLTAHFDSPSDWLNRVFLKGYQWPFDAAKAEASSRIDVLVWEETVLRGRRVFLDFRTDPRGLEQGFGALGDEARRYLEQSDALVPTPIERLRRLNPQAIDLYRAHGIDLTTQPLEIGVCAQHHNGGIAIDADWQSSVAGLYVAGEAAGTFGWYRPGGSALNATQVGSMRAARHIAESGGERTCFAETRVTLETCAAACLQQFRRSVQEKETVDLSGERAYFQSRMSACAAHVRREEQMAALQAEIARCLARYWETHSVSSPRQLPTLLKNHDMLVTQQAVLSAMRLSAQTQGSHGSALTEEEPEKPDMRKVITESDADGFCSRMEDIRALPEPNRWFETVWAAYRQRQNGKDGHT